MPQKSSARKKLTRQETRDLDIEIEFVEGLVRRDPDYVEALQLLGDHYTQRGKFEEGLKSTKVVSTLNQRTRWFFTIWRAVIPWSLKWNCRPPRCRKRFCLVIAISIGSPRIPIFAFCASIRSIAASGIRFDG